MVQNKTWSNRGTPEPRKDAPANVADKDCWKWKAYLVRVHLSPRRSFFLPSEVEVKWLSRVTYLIKDPSEVNEDKWTGDCGNRDWRVAW